jgi:hypothetical protein
MIIGESRHSDKSAKLLNPHGIGVFHGKGYLRKHYGRLASACRQFVQTSL